jgi:hypothetical protein
MAAVWVQLFSQLYLGDAIAARRLLNEYWPLVARSGYDRVNPWRSILAILEGSASLLCAKHWPHDRRYRRSARRCARELRKRPAGWNEPASRLITAGLAHLEGRRAEAARLYGEAAVGFERQDLPAFAVSARVRQASLLTGTDAAEMRARAQSWFEAQAIANPKRWTCLYAPIDA